MKLFFRQVWGLFFLLSLSLGFSACSPKTTGQAKQAAMINQKAVSSEGEDILLGRVNRQGLAEIIGADWFPATYQEYTVDANRLASLNWEGVDIVMFLGTWCSDSQANVPPFYKILDQVKFPEDKLTVYALDREKAMPGPEEEQFDVTLVPTIIVRRNGQELGRIIEYPETTLERDLAKMLQ
ncbi:MAG: thioredoxin family protein [Lewinellaceae bacterium]|nr:thioredoxin family protein [Lewinellaceae bacterium]